MFPWIRSKIFYVFKMTFKDEIVEEDVEITSCVSNILPFDRLWNFLRRNIFVLYGEGYMVDQTQNALNKLCVKKSVCSLMGSRGMRRTIQILVLMVS